MSKKESHEQKKGCFNHGEPIIKQPFNKIKG